MRASVRDFVLYVLIGLAVLVSALLYATYVPASKRISPRWGGLVIMTLITFGYPVKWYRRYWRVWRFWCIYAFMFVAHMAAFILLLIRVEHFGGIWLAMLSPIEWAVMCPIFDRAGRGTERESMGERRR